MSCELSIYIRAAYISIVFALGLQNRSKISSIPTLIIFKFIVRQIHREKEKNKHNQQFKKVNLNMEYLLENTEKPKAYDSRSFLVFSVQTTKIE